MESGALPAALVSLIHHVELDKAGWWDKAIQRVLVFAIWLDGGTSSAEQIRKVFEKEFAIAYDDGRMQRQIDELCGVGILVQLPGGKYRIGEQSLREYEQRIAEGQELENRVKTRFKKIFGNCCPTLDVEDIWNVFHSGLLIPIIKEMGARTYEIVSGSGPSVFATMSFQEFLRGYSPSLHQSIRDAVIAYLDPANPDIRSYALRHLNAYFFIEAASLTQETLDALATMAKRKPRFAVFLDTNVVFSALGIHENPSNEAARALVQLVQRLSPTVDAKLYVLPHTIEEARRALALHIEPLKGWKLTPNLAAAALKTGLTQFVQRFAQQVIAAGEPRTADDYFAPFVTDLMTMLRAAGIQVFNEKTDSYNMRQDVIDDIMGQTEHEKKTRGEQTKKYEQLEHDMVLWHFVLDKRPPAVESPLGAQFWIVTVDYRFLGFDSYKRRDIPTSIPICLHPTALIQMLQFWVPRTEQFEAAVLGTLRLPFMFQDFDREAERVTTTILRSLSRFDQAGDLSVETAHRVFMNRVLRQKIASEPNDERQIELVREALIASDKQRTAELRTAEKKAQHYEAQAAQLEKEVESKKREATDLKQERDTERAARQSVESRLEDIESALEAKRTEETRRREARGFALWVICSLLLVLVLATGISLVVRSFLARPLWVAGPLSGSILLIPWVWLCDKRGLACEHIHTRTAFVWFHRFRVVLFALLAVAAVGIYQGFAWSIAVRLWNGVTSSIR